MTFAPQTQNNSGSLISYRVCFFYQVLVNINYMYIGNIFKKNYFIEAIVTLTFDSDPQNQCTFSHMVQFDPVTCRLNVRHLLSVQN